MLIMEARIHVAPSLSIAFSDKKLVEKITQADQSKVLMNCLPLMVANHCLGKSGSILCPCPPRLYSLSKDILGFQKESWGSGISEVT